MATLLPGESVVFCLLASGELAGDEPKSDRVCFVGVVACDGVRDDPLGL